MKLLFALVLTGCVGNYETLPQERSVAPTEMHISRGQSQFGTWNCYQSNANDKVVWIECKFKNTSMITNNICIKVIYSSNNIEIAGSRKVCSGPLAPSQDSENYVAFTKLKREVLTKNCGIELNSCYLTTSHILY